MTLKIETARHDMRALIFLLAAAVEKTYAGKRTLVVDHSFGDGFYCFLKEEQPLSTNALQDIEDAMRALHAAYPRIKLRKPRTSDWQYLKGPRSTEVNTGILILGDYNSPSYEFTTLGLDDLPIFSLIPYEQGFLLRVAPDPDATELSPFHDTPRLFRIMRENEEWGRILGVSTVSDLNETIMDMGFKRVIWVAEALQEKKLAAIADAINARDSVQIIFVAGPSSSGKTTFTKRLSVQLAVNGIESKIISMDDYFLDRSEIRPQADGSLDFESIDCLDLKSLRLDLKRLIYGEPVHYRNYDFHSGRQIVLPETYQLNAHEVLILEGIHGLNPELVENIPDRSLYHIYISALTQLNIDATHPVSTSDGRLIRRIVRDHNYRGYAAKETMDRWNSVRHGELRNIFPFQEEADMIFNSAMVYELSVLKRYALPLLRQSPKNTVRDRLITLLSMFHSIPDRHIPGTSILREFIGKSFYSY